jgi:hypothetical protein
MTSAPSKIISSSINNLTVWNRESGPIPYCSHLFGAPCRYRIPHIDHHYYNTNATSSLILSWFDWDCCSSHLNVLRKKRHSGVNPKDSPLSSATAEHWGFESWSSESAKSNTSGMDPMGPNPNDRSKLGHGLVNRLTNSLCLADQFGQSAQILGDSPQNQPLTKHLDSELLLQGYFSDSVGKKVWQTCMAHGEALHW